MKSAKAPAGFTLLEVVVAMTILGLGFSAIFAGMSQSARNITKLEKVERREMFTRNLLAKLDLLQQLRPGDTSNGIFQDGTRWRLEVQPYIQPTPEVLAGIVRIELRLEWDGTSSVLSRTIETYRLVRSMAPYAPGLEAQLHALE